MIKCNLSYPYRLYGGLCNNLDNPLWGAAFTAQMRMLDPVFDKGMESSFCWSPFVIGAVQLLIGVIKVGIKW